MSLAIFAARGEIAVPFDFLQKLLEAAINIEINYPMQNHTAKWWSIITFLYHFLPTHISNDIVVFWSRSLKDSNFYSYLQKRIIKLDLINNVEGPNMNTKIDVSFDLLL